ncbi:PREDICTED: uncharacterized protein LOC109232474 [Nicotiana attenuata]|uniref:uncharacterized protein LOC109232474 n=1 Tax=Nicotiana attenuata TaxID=49451 RepID=UPI0009049CFE|nr:PREDICTED: uncharacterized protein LOC109232474 [Nicotiana attenuata]
MTTEIPWRGDYFTWTNGQMGADRVISIIDRALGNGEWMMKFGYLTVEIGDPFISDQSPLSLRFQKRNNSIKIPFRFLNVWADHEAFESIVTKGWQGKQQYCMLVTIWDKLKAMKTDFKNLNNKNFRDAAVKIEARRDIIECQQEMKKGYTDQLRIMEKEAKDQLEKWSLIEEKILQQKSRVQWINIGDGNNKYFFAVMKERACRNNNTTLTALNGAILTEPKSIKREIVEFYKSLMGIAAN